MALAFLCWWVSGRLLWGGSSSTGTRHGRSFTEVQVTGPFRFWQHVHRMVPQGPDACLLEDTIEYELPLGLVGRLLGQPFMRRKLRRLFAYRHAVTRQAYE